MPARSGPRLPAVGPPVPEDAVAAVFARAAELDLSQSPGAPGTGLDEEALVEIGGAVGLSPDAVRQAIAEHHAGALVPAAHPPATWVGPRLATAERRVRGEQQRLCRTLERELERQWFRRVQGSGERSVWAARTDLPARVARRLDLRHRLVLPGVSGLVVTAVACGPHDVVVRLEADPAEQRDGLGWMVAGTTAAGVVAGSVLATLVSLSPEILLALPSAGLAAGSGVALARRTYGRQVRRLTNDLEGILDVLHRAG